MTLDNLTVGVFLVLVVILVFLLVGKPVLLRFTLSELSKNKIESVVIIILTSIIISILSLPVISSITSNIAINRYLDFKTANSNGIIYSYDAIFDETEANKIYSLVRDKFDKYLPIRFETATFDDQNIILINYNPENSKTYISDNENYIDQLQNIGKDEAILSSTLARALDLKENTNITIRVKEANYTLKISKILEDNGLIGFDLPLDSIGYQKLGSIYVGNDFFNQDKEKYNAILLKSNKEYFPQTLESQTNFVIRGYNSSLNFEEIKQTFSEKMVVGSDGISFSQLFLIAMIITSIPLFLITIDRLKKVLTSNRDLYLSLKISGISEITLYQASILKSLSLVIIASIPTIIIVVITLLILESLNFQFVTYNSDYYNYIDFAAIIEGIGFGVISVLLVFISISGIISNKIHNEFINKFSLRKESLLLFGLLIGVLTFLYSMSDYPIGKDERNLFLYFGLIALTISIFRLAASGFQKYFKQLINIGTLMVFGISMIAISGENFSPGNQIIILLMIVNLLSVIFLLSTNQAFIMRKIRRILIFRNLFIQELADNPIYKINYRYFIKLLVLVIIVIFISLIQPAKNYLFDEIDKTSYKFDVVINDKIGNVISKTSLAQYQEAFAFGDVQIKDIKYKDLKKGLDNPQTLGKDDENFVDSISTLSNSGIQQIELYDGVNIDEFNDNYIILGKNYYLEKDNENIRPNLKIGDEIKILFNEKLEVKRKVYGFIKSKSDDGLIPSINGIFMSFNDYKNLQAKSNLNLNTVYGYNFNSEDELRSFVGLAKTLPISSITIEDQNSSIFISSINYIVIFLYCVLSILFISYLYLCRFTSVITFSYYLVISLLASLYAFFLVKQLADYFGFESKYFNINYFDTLIYITIIILSSSIYIFANKFYEIHKRDKK